jgi:hypothetical protein
MAVVKCPKCGESTKQGGYYIWQIAIAICFFPIGLLALLGNREPTVCIHCQHTWQE